MSKKQKTFIIALISSAISILFFITLVKSKYSYDQVQLGQSLTNIPNTTSNTIYNTKLQVGKQYIFVEVADTPAKQKKGLSGKKELKDGTGMIFPYDPPRYVSFWMPDMNFPIDIVYIKDSTIFQIYHNVPNHPSDFPKEKLPSYRSNRPVDLVLEVPAGWCQTHQIQEGSRVHILTDNN